MTIKPSLLVADDEIEIGKIVKAIGEELGFEVTCVAEGSEVVNLVNRLKPDVIALDLRMPGADGVEIIRELGKQQCKSGILLMSGMDQRTLSTVQTLGKENNLDIGSTLTKPMSLDAIQTALTPYLGKTETSASKTNASAAQVHCDCGLDILYEPEFQLKPLDEEATQRLRIRAQWHTDDNRVIDSLALGKLAKECGIRKGLSKMILAQSLETVRVWSNQDFKPEVSIQLDESFLTDLSTPDVLALLADQYHVPREWIAIEIDEELILDRQDSVSDVLSRMRIKGFKIVIAAAGDGEKLLPLMDSIPLDQIVIDLSRLESNKNYLSDMEIEFRYSSFTSTTHKKGIAACAENVNCPQMLEFVKRCNFHSARGRQLLVPSRASEILPLYQSGKFSSSQ